MNAKRHRYKATEKNVNKYIKSGEKKTDRYKVR